MIPSSPDRSFPRYVLDIEKIEEQLGAPLGPLLVELSRMACKLDPFCPMAAFEPLQMDLVYLNEESPTATPLVPDDALIFLETGANGTCAGFLDDGSGRPLDEREVCLVRKGESWTVAPNLATFLGMVAVAGTEAIDPERDTDEGWFECREERLADEEDGFRALSEKLCTLPGVTLHRKGPVPKYAYWCYEPPSEPQQGGLAGVRQLLRKGKRRKASVELVKQINVVLSVADLVPPERWGELQELVTALKPNLAEPVRAELAKRGVQ
ncbi:hypothetical protein LZC95_47880 [Pendulispora brunnea]|uniref:Knr4/Smi1-like domain-containing protein n=1 Tax=Pendulispora brunnea TaxID=2905690 RepID=A0ABZ2K630_9BACT